MRSVSSPGPSLTLRAFAAQNDPLGRFAALRASRLTRTGGVLAFLRAKKKGRSNALRPRGR